MQANWYAVQSGVHQEKQVAARLQERDIECFLPVYQDVHQRSDRKVVLQMPLFPGYLFVHIALCDRLRVLNIPRVVRLIGAGQTPLALPEEDIDALRTGLAHRRAMPHPYLQVGQRVRVIAGLLEGLEGTLIRRKRVLRLVLSIEAILRSFTVEVDESEIEPVRGRSLVCR